MMLRTFNEYLMEIVSWRTYLQPHHFVEIEKHFVWSLNNKTNATRLVNQCRLNLFKRKVKTNCCLKGNNIYTISNKSIKYDTRVKKIGDVNSFRKTFFPKKKWIFDERRKKTYLSCTTKLKSLLIPSPLHLLFCFIVRKSCLCWLQTSISSTFYEYLLRINVFYKAFFCT